MVSPSGGGDPVAAFRLGRSRSPILDIAVVMLSPLVACDDFGVRDPSDG
jgi:hypothetical protein